ncbi:MAG: alpha-ribazole phosphatase [Firmicutes bacterium]|nr:alpha-ribazole phosphatase [Bacillota bacterium]
MLIWMVRHGETEWNHQSRYQGHTDVPLNEVGIIQSRQAAERLASEPITAVYSSDLTRARTTAEIIAASHGLTVRVKKGLRESNYGKWEGMTFKEIKAVYPGAIERWLDNPQGSRPPDGESLWEVRERALAAVDEIRGENPEDSSLVIVTHGGVIAMLLMTYLKEGPEFLRRFFGRNASISKIEFRGEDVEVLEWSDASHLER